MSKNRRLHLAVESANQKINDQLQLLQNENAKLMQQNSALRQDVRGLQKNVKKLTDNIMPQNAGGGLAYAPKFRPNNTLDMCESNTKMLHALTSQVADLSECVEHHNSQLNSQDNRLVTIEETGKRGKRDKRKKNAKSSSTIWSNGQQRSTLYCHVKATNDRVAELTQEIDYWLNELAHCAKPNRAADFAGKLRSIHSPKLMEKQVEIYLGLGTYSDKRSWRSVWKSYKEKDKTKKLSLEWTIQDDNDPCLKALTNLHETLQKLNQHVDANHQLSISSNNDYSQPVAQLNGYQ